MATYCEAQVPPPTALCGSMSEINAFELVWDAPAGADPLLNYEIYRDSGTGFELIAVLTGPATVIYNDFGIVPTDVNRYYVRSVLNGDFSTTTDTLQNIVLNVNASVPSVAQLSWTFPYDDMPITGSFDVFRIVDGDPELLVATLPQTVSTYNDTLFGLCDLTDVTYYVAHQKPTCTSASQRKTDEFRDLMPPAQPKVETASVDPLTGDITVFWNNINAPDLAFYRIQDIDLVTQQFITVGVVDAGEEPEFVYESAGLASKKTLAVIAFDACGNDASFGATVTTMFAEAAYTECNLDAMVSWTPYQGWPEGVSSYQIKAYIDGADPFTFAEVDASATFHIVEVEPNREYCFYVEAISIGGQRNSTSNGDCVVTNYPSIATHVSLATVTVLDPTRIEVSLFQDQASVGTTYELFRSRQGGGFVSLGTFAQSGDEYLTFIDEGLDARNIKYTYRWRASDGCGAVIGNSNTGTNIVLDAIAEPRELKNYLSWNAFQFWENGVAQYQVWRKVGGELDFTLYATVDANTLIFEDDVEQFREAEGEFCYKVIAIEAVNSFGRSSESVSYEDCVTQPPIMWIPSAIVINGAPDNQVFKPVAGFIDFDTYRMEIYTKWSQLIFSSDNIVDGWDGTFKGNVVREDFYRYIITYRDGSGKPFVEQDVVYVLKK